MMKRPALYLLTLMGALSPFPATAAIPEIPTDQSQETKPLTIKVMLAKLAPEATLEVKGRFRVYNRQTNQLIESGHSRWNRLTFTKSGLKWGDLYPGQFELRIVPSGPDAELLVNGHAFRGALEIYGIAGTVNLINEVDLENYLKATLSSKITEKLDREVADALVITERTHLAYLATKNPQANWQLNADQAHYEGQKTLDPSLEEAIERTHGTVMVFQGRLFPASWNRHTAGRTVSYSSIFRKNAQMPAGVAALPSHSSREEVKWTAAIPKQLLAELAGLDQIQQVELYKAEGSSKVYALRLSDGIQAQHLDFFHLQQAIGPKLLKSNDFSLRVEDDNIHFSGYGEGTGVGLCLASAQLLAEQQEDARKILVTHFPGVILKKLGGSNDQMTCHVWK